MLGPEKVGLCIPTLNAANALEIWIRAFEMQTYKPKHILIIDSSSSDNTLQVAIKAGFAVHSIQRMDFNHGRTRQLAADIIDDVEVIIFMTQDAIYANPDAIKKLINCFNNNSVGAAYGRQLPALDASPIATHARLFNYPSVSKIKDMADAPILGIKTAFISNSFAAYRRTALMAVGGFPRKAILSEDTYVAAQMILSGWKIAYCAEAQVYHSHNYGFIEESKRYFDLGVFHAHEPWIRQNFGHAEGEGVRYIYSELRYLWSTKPSLIFSALLRTIFKLIGYRLGCIERYLPVKVKRIVSMHPHYWSMCLALLLINRTL